MPLDRLITQIPSEIGNLTITLSERVVSPMPEHTLQDGTVVPATSALARDVYGEAIVQDQNGQGLKVWQGNLLNPLTTAQKVWLVQFIVDMRSKAVSELLPPP